MRLFRLCASFLLVGGRLAAEAYRFAADFDGTPGFYHGVASGSPLADAVIIWTRYTPVGPTDVVPIEYRIAEYAEEEDETTSSAKSNENDKFSEEAESKQDKNENKDRDKEKDKDENKNKDKDKEKDKNEGNSQEEETEKEKHKNIFEMTRRKGLLDPAKNPSVRHGIVEARPENDWTIKLDVQQLKPKTSYVFAFTDGQSATSPVGRAKTAPAADDPVTEGLRFAVFSCSNFRSGYFHVYDIASRLEDLDVWFHLGDYIYESFGGRPNPKWERAAALRPLGEVYTLHDYRLRYATYHTDPALQRLRATAPLIATWDDHEFADNAFRRGARGHDETLHGPWRDRVRAAVQAYLEWIPIRPSPGPMGPFIQQVSIAQTLSFGALATVVTFDTRLSHRSAKPPLHGDPIRRMTPAYRHRRWHNVTAYQSEPLVSKFHTLTQDILKKQYNPHHKIIGNAKTKYLGQVFQQSKTEGKPWQIFAVPILMGYNVFPPFDTVWQYAPPKWRRLFRKRLKSYMAQDPRPGGGGNFRATIPLAHDRVCQAMDGWCGAALERARILQVMQQTAITPIVLGGDRHSSWAWTLYEGGNYTGKPVAINVGGPGVTSGGEGKDLVAFFRPLVKRLVKQTQITTTRALYRVFEEAWEQWNEGLVYANIEERGFFAGKLTPQHAFFEYFFISHDTLKTNYDKFQGTGAPFECRASLRADAGKPGSLHRRNKNKDKPCDVFSFRKKKNPHDWVDISVPVKFQQGDDVLQYRGGILGQDE